MGKHDRRFVRSSEVQQVVITDLDRWANFFADEDCRFWKRTAPHESDTYFDGGTFEREDDGHLSLVTDDSTRSLNVVVEHFRFTSELQDIRRKWGGHNDVGMYMWQHRVKDVTGEPTLLPFDSKHRLYEPNCHAIASLWLHDFKPEPNWLMAESFEGDEVRCIEAIRIIEGIADGDEAGLRAAIARRLFEAAPKQRPCDSVVTEHGLYLVREDHHVVLYPDGEWDFVPTTYHMTPLVRDVACTWLRLRPDAYSLIDTKRLNGHIPPFKTLPTVVHELVQEFNCEAWDRKQTLALLRMLLSDPDRWPQRHV